MKTTIITIIAIVALFVLFWCLFMYYKDRNFRRTLAIGKRVRVYLGENKYYGTIKELNLEDEKALIYFPEDGAKIWFQLSDIYTPLQ